VIVWSVLLACATTTSLGSARTLPQGELQHGVATELGLVDSRPIVTPLLRFDYGVRYGMLDELEIGAHVGLWPLFGNRWIHAGFDAKYRLHFAPSPNEGWDVSVATGLAYDRATVFGIQGQAFTVTQSLLVGKNTRRGHQWVVVPRVAYERITSKGASPVTKGMVGLAVGPAITRERLTLHPQLGWWWSTNAADAVARMNVWSLSWSVSWH